jgi:glycerophosphoryl diester phosphodiesterase
VRDALVIAHRGASRARPENTLPAYALAVEQGADMIEIDLHRTRDGAVVVTHDEGLGGLGGTGEIAEATLAAVRSLDAGAGEQVPLLDEVLDTFGDRISFNLELKQASEGPYEGLEAMAWKAVVDRGLAERTLFSSFYDAVLRTLRSLAAEARIGLLLSPRFPRGWQRRAADLGAEALNPERSLVDAALVREAHSEGLAVNVFTVDDRDEMTKLLDLGVDGIFTNLPDQMRALLDQRSPRPVGGSSPRVS